MSSIKKKLQVFVSSTYLDLKEERQSAVSAILKAGHIPAGMELFSAGNDSQLDTIRRWIDESDIYMLILGARYGSVDTRTSLSYTELEYDYAISKDKPVFAVVITDDAIDKKVHSEGRQVVESEYPAELKSFRKKVLSKISSFFNDSKDIKLAVHETLSDFINRYEFVGWVSGADVLESRALIEEVIQLRKINIALEKENIDLKKSIEKPKIRQSGKWDDEEVKQIISLLQDIEIKTDAFDEGKEPIRTSVLRLVLALRDRLITGVTNRYDIGKVDSLLYFNVCPKLEVHGLTSIEKVPNVAWQRYRLTAKGLAVLAYIDKNKLFEKKAATQDVSQAVKPITRVKKIVAE